MDLRAFGRVTLFAGVALASVRCGGPAAAGPAAATTPSASGKGAVAPSLPRFVTTAPAGTRLLARIAVTPSLGSLPGMQALLGASEACGLEPERVTEVHVALAEPAAIRIDVLGAVDEEAIQCLARRLHAEGLVTSKLDGGVRLATADALADGPGAPPELAAHFAAPLTKGADFAASFSGGVRVTARLGDFLDARVELPDGDAERAVAWLERDLGAAKVRDLEKVLTVTACDGALVLHAGGLDAATSLAIAADLRARVLESFRSPSNSMLPTLLIGDHFYIDKTAGRPARADVVVFRFPENRAQDFVKRVVALPGDELVVVAGRPVVNGKLAPRCYVGPHDFAADAGDKGLHAEIYLEALGGKTYLTAYDERDPDRACEKDPDCAAGDGCRAGVCGRVQGPWRVAKDEAWVMGDARDNSHDSRSWRNGLGGGVPLDDVKGTVVALYLSLGPNGVRWDRGPRGFGGPAVLPFEDATLQESLARCLRQLAE